jgi:hypothetical protein
MMSLSLAFTSLLLRLYRSVSGCTADTCWRHNLVYLGIVSTAVMLPGSFSLRLYREEPKGPERSPEEGGAVNRNPDIENESLLDDNESLASLEDSLNQSQPVSSLGQSRASRLSMDGSYMEATPSPYFATKFGTPPMTPVTGPQPGPFGASPATNVLGGPLSSVKDSRPASSASVGRKGALAALHTVSHPAHHGDEDSPSRAAPNGTPVVVSASFTPGVTFADDGEPESATPQRSFRGGLRRHETDGNIAPPKSPHAASAPVPVLSRSGTTGSLFGEAEVRAEAKRLEAEKKRAEADRKRARRQRAMLKRQSASLASTHSLLVSLRVFQHPYFWVLFLGYFAAIGSGVLVITDFKLWSRVAPGKDYSFFLNIFFSIANCCGTLLAGWISDYLMKKHYIPRSDVLSGFMIYGGINMVGLATTVFFMQSRTESVHLQILLLVLCVNSGLSFGSAFSLFPSLSSEIYGAENFGKYFGFLQIGSTSSLVIPILSTAIQKKFDNYYAVFYAMGVVQILSGALALVPQTDYEVPMDLIEGGKKKIRINN